MKGLPAALVSKAKHCLDTLETAIANGDTRQVRECAESFRKGGREADIQQLIALADELESSAIECNLGASLKCLATIQELIGLNANAIS